VRQRPWYENHLGGAGSAGRSRVGHYLRPLPGHALFLKGNGAVTNKPPFGFDVTARTSTSSSRRTTRAAVRAGIFGRCISGSSVDTLARWLEDTGAETRAHRAWRLGRPGHPRRRTAQRVVGQHGPADRQESRVHGPLVRVQAGSAPEDQEAGPGAAGQALDPVTGKLVPDRNEDGTLRYEYGAVIMEVEPLVDADTWQRANDALSTRGKRKPRSASPAMLSGGVLSCLECGGPMLPSR